MEQEDEENVITFVVEHMEQYLYDWCLYQYSNMKQYLSKTNCVLVITNIGTIQNYHGPFQEQNINNLNQLKKNFNTQQTKLVPESITKLDKLGVLNVQSLCLLDMRAKEPLIPNQKWNTVVFGGILGDHPPRDRSAPLRNQITQLRHLGTLQLATDTAVLMTKLILKNKLNLQDIPLIEEPTLKGVNSKGQRTTVQMEGFSYVSKELNIETGEKIQGLSKKEKKNIYMHEGIANLLLNEDLDSNKIM